MNRPNSTASRVRPWALPMLIFGSLAGTSVGAAQHVGGEAGALALKVASRINAETEASSDASAQSAAVASVLTELYFKGKYAEVGTRGLALLQADGPTPDDELRLKIANSLAWSNRLSAAIPEYQALVRSSTQTQPARLSLANSYRWSGRPDLSMPLYEDFLARDPENTDGKDGVEYAQRDLRPRTTVTLGSSSDSGDMKVGSGTVTHRWRDPSMVHVYEVEGALARDRQGPIGPNPQHVGGTFRYENVESPYQPQLHVSAQLQPGSGLYGGGRMLVPDTTIHVSLARENFGVTALSAKALAAGLSATRLGADASWGGSLGVLSGNINLYDISDGNSLRTTSLKYAPDWRPLGMAFKPYVSMDTRDVSFNTPNYWSPLVGSGTLGLGATAEWAEKDWFFFMAAQVGTRLYGESGTRSWSASIGGQRWITRDLALTVNLWGMASFRDNSRYRAHSTTIKLDKLW